MDEKIKNIKKYFSHRDVQQIANEYVYPDLKQVCSTFHYETNLGKLYQIVRSRNVELEHAVLSSLKKQERQKVSCDLCMNFIYIQNGTITSTCNCKSIHAVKKHLNG